jgi:hypothetical protein
MALIEINFTNMWAWLTKMKESVRFCWLNLPHLQAGTLGTIFLFLFHLIWRVIPLKCEPIFPILYTKSKLRIFH